MASHSEPPCMHGPGQTCNEDENDSPKFGCGIYSNFIHSTSHYLWKVEIITMIHIQTRSARNNVCIYLHRACYHWFSGSG